MPAITKPPQLDEIDLDIIYQLQKDARLTIRELAERVGMSPSATAERMRRLEELGVIIGYRAMIDYDRLGMPIHGYILMHNMEPKEAPQRLALLRSRPEITAIERVVSGGMDVVLHICCRTMGQLVALQSFLDQHSFPNFSTYLCSLGLDKLEPADTSCLRRDED